MAPFGHTISEDFDYLECHGELSAKLEGCLAAAAADAGDMKCSRTDGLFRQDFIDPKQCQTRSEETWKRLL